MKRDYIVIAGVDQDYKGVNTMSPKPIQSTLERTKKHWSQEELDYLEDYFGSISNTTIAMKLDRSTDSVATMATKLQLGKREDHVDTVTLPQLAEILGMKYSGVLFWKNHKGLPVMRMKVYQGKPFYVVKFPEFWDWLYKYHKVSKKVCITQIEKWDLGEEPDWVDKWRARVKMEKEEVAKKKKADWMNHNSPTFNRKGNMNPEWSDEELKDGEAYYQLGYTYEEISSMINYGVYRSPSSVKCRAVKSGWKQKYPVNYRRERRKKRLMKDRVS